MLWGLLEAGVGRMVGENLGYVGSEMRMGGVAISC